MNTKQKMVISGASPKLKPWRKATLLLLCMLGAALVATAFVRQAYTDAEVVWRSDVIVVGRMKAGSLKFIYHPGSKEDEQWYGHPCGFWDHQLELIVSETLKGVVATTTIPVMIRYGLDVLVGGVESNQFRQIDARCGDTNYPPSLIAVYDTGNSVASYMPLTGDIRSNHIWCLRYFKFPSYGQTNVMSIFDPEDVRSTAWRQHLNALIKAAEPEKQAGRNMDDVPHTYYFKVQDGDGSPLTHAVLFLGRIGFNHLVPKKTVDSNGVATVSIKEDYELVYCTPLTEGLGLQVLSRERLSRDHTNIIMFARDNLTRNQSSSSAGDDGSYYSPADATLTVEQYKVISVAEDYLAKAAGRHVYAYYRPRKTEEGFRVDVMLLPVDPGGGQRLGKVIDTISISRDGKVTWMTRW